VPSDKTEVIEWIFFRLKYDHKQRTVINPVVTFDEVADGIEAMGSKLSEGNRANFWKDLTRGNLNKNWPETVFTSGFTGADAIGEGAGACFKFAEVLPGQMQPSIDRLSFDEKEVRTHQIESLSMPVATKALGRQDENWLAQVSVRLHIVETHFAIFSSRPVAEISFLQTGVKLRKAEVDAAFSVTDSAGVWLLSVEAKGKREHIHLPQIKRASLQFAETKPVAIGAVGVIPFALKIVGKSKIWCVEFVPLVDSHSPMVVASQGVIELLPHVQGIE
jgi:hypothetical protein